MTHKEEDKQPDVSAHFTALYLERPCLLKGNLVNNLVTLCFTGSFILYCFPGSVLSILQGNFFRTFYRKGSAILLKNMLSW